MREVLHRLLRWGWPEEEARALAERIQARDAFDDRRTCLECSAYRPGRCANSRATGLASPIIGRQWASLPQRCPGFGAAGAGGEWPGLLDAHSATNPMRPR
ncbi:MAG: hypothetical protein U1E77_06545 [Inhella sp.]